LLPYVISNGDITSTMRIHEMNALKGNDSTLHKILFLFSSLYTGGARKTGPPSRRPTWA